MQEVITTYDFVLLPAYLFLFYLIVKRKAKKYTSIGLKKHFIIAFWLRMIGAVAYGLLIQYYYGYGDTIGFYKGGDVLSRMIQEDITAIKYLFMPANDVVAAAKAMGFEDDIPVTMANDSNAIVMKFSAVLSFLTFNKYLLISIGFGFFSFSGIWKLFYVFYQLNGRKHVRLLAFFVLYFPSIWFWGSGLLKEPICIGALGFIVYIVYKNFVEKRFSKRDMLTLLLMLFILTIVKGYITGILMVSFLALIFYNAICKIKNLIFRFTAFVIILVVLTITLFTLDVTVYVKDFVDSSFSQIQAMQRSYQAVQEIEDVSNKGAFLITNMNPSFESIILNSPGVISTCLFRPFIWESQKIIIFFASLEALLTLLFTLYILLKTKFLGFFAYIFSNAFLLFCFIFSILAALVIGYTTFNFGTLIRYKIILLPFYFFILIHIYTRITNRKAAG